MTELPSLMHLSMTEDEQAVLGAFTEFAYQSLTGSVTGQIVSMEAMVQVCNKAGVETVEEFLHCVRTLTKNNPKLSVRTMLL